ncbi:MAG: nuclear transport factor 2 family protein [Bernardetiaceae bacterium]|nr:nuclear transport factor 2 family protein [Bernardetiaceae bacterium]
MLVLLGGLAAEGAAQVAPARQDPGEAGVKAAIEQLFTAMRQADSSLVKQVLAPEARLLTVDTGTGRAVVKSTPIAGFVKAIGTKRAQVLDERLLRYEIRIDGPLATAWTPYRFYLGEQFSHCGVNCFQLYLSEQGWQIIQITDTRRKEPCPE